MDESEISFRLDLPLYITVNRAHFSSDEEAREYAYNLVGTAVRRIGTVKAVSGELDADAEYGDIELQPWDMKG